MAHRNSTKHYDEPSSSLLRTPPPISTYPNLQGIVPVQSSIEIKTRRQLSEPDAQECMRILTGVFGHSSYKGRQREIVEAAYAGADVLVVAPTGMGKSLCFQVPAVADKRGLSVVVSPLLALMQNQLDNLRLKKVEVVALHSQVPYIEREQIRKSLQEYDTQIKLLYTTPERMCNEEFMQLLDIVHDNHNLNRLIVDEAHCISEWGHNFREEYRRLGRFRDKYPEVPIMALTATATTEVQRDIIMSLKLDENYLFVALHPFNRSNLYYEVRCLSNPQPLNQMAEIFEYIMTIYRRRGQPSSGIIYCRFRKSCDELSAYLRGKGLNARPYHRGVPSATLEKTLTSWTKGVVVEGGPVDVVVATIAFGLGIDKGDVRYIIHYDLPKSFEGYYQETGRAGRDGHPSKCILYYSREDAISVKKFVRSSNSGRTRGFDDDEPTPTQRASGSLETLIQFAESAALCRHVAICRYFGEPIDDNDKNIVETYCNRMCDVCRYPDKTKARLTKLSSKEVAITNTSFSGTALNTIKSASSNTNRQSRRDQGRALKTQSSLGQKRGQSSDGVAQTKKPKASHVSVLVTKPFKSSIGLTKPFRQPTFVERSTKENPPQSTVSSEIDSSAREPACKPEASIPLFQELNCNVFHEEDQESPLIDLPHVDIIWEPVQSAKASYSDRLNSLNALRSTLHRSLIHIVPREDFWAKICSGPVEDTRKFEIIFEVAVELESSVLSLSSTSDGYKQRIEVVRDDIRALSSLELWDSDKKDFEASQEIIQCLRQYFCVVGKG